MPEGVVTEGHPYNEFIPIRIWTNDPTSQFPLGVVVGVALRGHPLLTNTTITTRR